MIDRGSAIEKPMKEPKVTIERRHRPGMLVAEDGELLLDVRLHRAEGDQTHDQQGRDDVEGIATHMLIRPSPVGAGR